MTTAIGLSHSYFVVVSLLTLTENHGLITSCRLKVILKVLVSIWVISLMFDHVDRES